MPEKIFEGIKVADFTWVGVGPITIKNLADHGATVVHIESHTHLDTLRMTPPFKDGIAGVDRSAFVADYNTNKYGISLDINTPRGVEIARELILWADVVAESFSPRAMGKWGLDYESIRKLKPDIIYYSASQQGHGGPHSGFIGFGMMMASLSGYAHLTGWPDRDPAPPYGAYTDFISPFFGAVALVAALDHKRKTGVGQHLDLSQLECGLQLLAPVQMDYVLNGHEMKRDGNRDPRAAPHNAYPCRGEDSWCAIAVFTDEEWTSLCMVMAKPEWVRDSRFETLEARKAHEDELDRLIGEWTQEREAQEVMESLQSMGVPAGVVLTAEGQFDDPQIRYRNFFRNLDHQVIGRHAYDGFSFELSRTPGNLTAAPTLGQHNAEVYSGMLGYSREELSKLRQAGVV